MTKTSSTAAPQRRSKPLSPDILEVLHMLSSLEQAPQRPLPPAAAE